MQSYIIEDVFEIVLVFFMICLDTATAEEGIAKEDDKVEPLLRRPPPAIKVTT